jgi:hypothetical protein
MKHSENFGVFLVVRLVLLPLACKLWAPNDCSEGWLSRFLVNLLGKLENIL